MDTENQELRQMRGQTSSSGEMNPVPGNEEQQDPHSLHMEEAEPEHSDVDEAPSTQEWVQQAAEYKRLADQWQKQAEENRQQYLRALADLENFRRRARKEKEDAVKYAVVPLLEALLPVLDNFERALEAADQNHDAQALQEGIEMVYRQFLNVLSQAGLTLIEAEGKPFDPHQHHAVMQVDSEEHEPGMVVEELQAGYRYLDRVIRPSMVKISS
ncbi:nucleotide exchange factor GrpE [Lihuaxuella thermophila]|nr:nucleotide exchange factor GrpE [Lihuaxuella thermophila]